MDLTNLDNYLDFSKQVFPKLQTTAQKISEGWIIKSINPQLNLEPEYWSEQGIIEDIDNAFLFDDPLDAIKIIDKIASIYQRRQFVILKAIAIINE